MSVLGLALAASLPGQPAKTVLGTVAGFKPESLELSVRADNGATSWLKFGADTEVVLIAPGERDLTKAQPAKIADIGREDRVMVSFVAGSPAARRIVVVSATAIARRDAAERVDWDTRGLSGVVAGLDGDQIALEMRSPQGVQKTTVVVGPKTKIRRYAPDSVKFADAQPGSLIDLAIGDQIRTRGDRNADGSRLIAEDVVFGTFLTTLGSITEINRESGEIKIVDANDKKTLTVRLTADTQIKKMPSLREMMFGSPGGASHQAPAQITPKTGSMSQILQSLPAGKIEDLTAGSSVIITSTRGATPSRVTGIMIIANVDALIQMAQSQAAGASPMDALNKLHGGMMTGPGGFSLPAIGQ